MYIFDLSIYGIHIAPTWYGLMYALGFIICYIFLTKYFQFKKGEDIDTLLTYVFFGIILGGRIGYVIFYDPSYFIENPLQIIKIWEGGMSFHGGLLGTIFSVYLYCRIHTYIFWNLIDTLAVIIPAAIGLGRIGNWINQELPGYAPYTGIFPMKIGGIYHFPSPLLEMLLEGITLLLVMTALFIFYKKNKPGFLSGIFLIGYSIARIISEQYRLPDKQIGYLFGTEYITLGIIYSIPMLLFGIYLILSKKTKPLPFLFQEKYIK